MPGASINRSEAPSFDPVREDSGEIAESYRASGVEDQDESTGRHDGADRLNALDNSSKIVLPRTCVGVVFLATGIRGAS